MTISKSTEAGAAGKWPARRHNQRERKVIETVETFAPAVAGNWSPAPTTQDGALDQLAARSAALEAFPVVHAELVTTAGGAAAEAIAVVGVLATDVCIVTLHTAGATPRTVVSAVCSADAVTVTFSGDPSTDHVINLVVVRV